MTNADFTTSFDVDANPAETFAAICDVRGWWDGDLQGETHALGDEFTYRYADLHFSRQRITELAPGQRVAWLVVESRLSFVAQQNKWDGTTIAFDIAPRGTGSRVTFTHKGLMPEQPCYDNCSSAWSYYMDCLRNFVAESKAAATAAA